MDIILAPFNLLGDVTKTIIAIPNNMLKTTERIAKPLTRGVGQGVNNLTGSLKGITNSLPLIAIAVVAILLIKK